MQSCQQKQPQAISRAGPSPCSSRWTLHKVESDLVQERHGHTAKDQTQDTQLIEGPTASVIWGEVGLFTSWREGLLRMRWNLINTRKQNWSAWDESMSNFPQQWLKRVNRDKLNQKKFYMHKRIYLLITRGVKHGKRLPREAVESPSMKLLKTWVNTVIRNLIQLVLPNWGWSYTTSSPKVPCHLNHSVILY